MKELGVKLAMTRCVFSDKEVLEDCIREVLSRSGSHSGKPDTRCSKSAAFVIWMKSCLRIWKLRGLGHRTSLTLILRAALNTVVN